MQQNHDRAKRFDGTNESFLQGLWLVPISNLDQLLKRLVAECVEVYCAEDLEKSETLVEAARELGQSGQDVEDEVGLRVAQERYVRVFVLLAVEEDPAHGLEQPEHFVADVHGKQLVVEFRVQHDRWSCVHVEVEAHLHDEGPGHFEHAQD